MQLVHCRTVFAFPNPSIPTLKIRTYLLAEEVLEVPVRISDTAEHSYKNRLWFCSVLPDGYQDSTFKYPAISIEQSDYGIW